MSTDLNKRDLVPHVFVEKVHNWGEEVGFGEKVPMKFCKTTLSTLAINAINGCFGATIVPGKR